MNKFAIALSIAFSLGLLTGSFANTLTVTTTADDTDPCTPQHCSLRAAITAANDRNANPPPTTIVFASGVTGTIGVGSALPTIRSDVTITGPGPAQLKISRTSGSGFAILQTDNYLNVSISGLTVSDNQGQSGLMPAIYSKCNLKISNCTFANNVGGALEIDLYGALVAVDSTFQGNSDADLGAAIKIHGGAITIARCTFVDNQVTGSGAGGAIWNGGSNKLAVENCTFVRNKVVGASGRGGAMANIAYANKVSLSVLSCTFSGNGAASGGGIYNEAKAGGNAFATVENTILASTATDPGDNITNVGEGTGITSKGHNLCTDSGNGFLNAQGDQINVSDPGLGPLQDHGGHVQTMALLAGSPAVDQGADTVTNQDARGFARPVDNASVANVYNGADIGAFEADAPQPGPDFTVTNLNDYDDAECSFNDCTLREALARANSAPATTSIYFRYELEGTINLQQPLNIAGPASIHGHSNMTVNGKGAVPVFVISAGGVSIEQLKIASGRATLDGNHNAAGGGLVNRGTNLTVSDCTFTLNLAIGGDATTAGTAGGYGYGGAVANYGQISLFRCTFSFNEVAGGKGANGLYAVNAIPSGGAGGEALGAAIYNDAAGSLYLENCTFAANAATGGDGGDGDSTNSNFIGGNGGNAGSAIYNLGTAHLNAGTLTNNSGVPGTGGKGGGSCKLCSHASEGLALGAISAAGGNTEVANTLCAANWKVVTSNGSQTKSYASDVDGAFSSDGFNLIGIGDASSGFTATGDQVGTSASRIDPKLEDLKDNGGHTFTCALLAGSPAIDAGKFTGTFATDQRSAPRPLDDANVPNASGSDSSDIGAYESGGHPPAPPSATTYPPTDVTSTSATLSGVINSHGIATTGYFYSSDFPNPLAQFDAGNGTTNMPCDASVTGLTPNTTYTYYIAAANAGGNAAGETVSFTTSSPSDDPSATPSPVPTATPTPAPVAQLLNISTRMVVLTGDNVLIGGFIVTGTQPKKVLVRAIGPSLPTAKAA